MHGHNWLFLLRCFQEENTRNHIQLRPRTKQLVGFDRSSHMIIHNHVHCRSFETKYLKDNSRLLVSVKQSLILLWPLVYMHHYSFTSTSIKHFVQNNSEIM